MEEPIEQHQQKPVGRASRFQFSLGTLLAVVAGAALLCGLMFTGPHWACVPLLLLVTLLVPGLLTVAIVYGRRHQRAFAIGAIWPPALLLPPLLFGLVRRFYEGGLSNLAAWLEFVDAGGPVYRCYFGLILLTSFLGGILGVAASASTAGKGYSLFRL